MEPKYYKIHLYPSFPNWYDLITYQPSPTDGLGWFSGKQVRVRVLDEKTGLKNLHAMPPFDIREAIQHLEYAVSQNLPDAGVFKEIIEGYDSNKLEYNAKGY